MKVSLSLCFGVFAACVVLKATPDSNLKIAVNSTTIESFPLFAAAAEDSSIQLVPTPNGRTAMAQLVSGAADAATGSETQALLNSVTDPRIRIILTLAECRYRIVARRSRGIRRVADLRGKKVAVTVNTSSHYYLDGMLSRAHIDQSSVQVIGMEGQEMPAALKAGTVDAVSIWEPHAQNSLEALGKDTVVLEDPSVYLERFNLNTRSDVLAAADKRRALMRLVEGVARASVRLRAKPGEMIPMVAGQMNYPERTVVAVWRQFKFPATLSPKLENLMDEIEPWVARMQQRQPRPRQALVGLIDERLIAEIKR